MLFVCVYVTDIRNKARAALHSSSREKENGREQIACINQTRLRIGCVDSRWLSSTRWRKSIRLRIRRANELQFSSCVSGCIEPCYRLRVGLSTRRFIIKAKCRRWIDRVCVSWIRQSVDRIVFRFLLAIRFVVSCNINAQPELVFSYLSRCCH